MTDTILPTPESVGVSAKHFELARKYVLLTMTSSMGSSVDMVYDGLMNLSGVGSVNDMPPQMKAEFGEQVALLQKVTKEELIRGLDELEKFVVSKAALRWAQNVDMMTLETAITWLTSEAGQTISTVFAKITPHAIQDNFGMLEVALPKIYRRIYDRLPEGEMKEIVAGQLKEVDMALNEEQ